MRDPVTGAMARVDGQKMVAATFRHDTSRNLDPQLHTHCVIANMALGGDGKWRTMVDDGLFRQQKAIGAIYRSELAQGLYGLGYGVEKTHSDGRFEIAGVPQKAIDAFSTRRAEIEAAMESRGLGSTADNPALADRAALMTRAKKREVDREALRGSWRRQAAGLGFAPERMQSHRLLAEYAPDLSCAGESPEKTAGNAAAWAAAHLAERQSVFGHAELVAATLSRDPGAISLQAAERAISDLNKQGSLHLARGLAQGRHWTTEAALARESETIALMRAGQGVEKTIMRPWVLKTHLHKSKLNAGQKSAIEAVLASRDRVVGVQGYAGTGKTTMLNRLRALVEKRGYRPIGLAPSASAAKTLAHESGIPTETLQRFLAWHEGIAQGRGTAKGLQKLRAVHAKSVLVVDESSLASSEQMRNLLRVATRLRMPRVVLVGDEKQLGAVEAGKPFAQLQAAGMQTAVMDDILRQHDEKLKAAVKASLTGGVKTAFGKLGENVLQVEPEELAAKTAQRWLDLKNGERDRTGVIAPTRALRNEINAKIRNGLQAEGAISGPVRRRDRLVPRDLTRAQMSRAQNYDVGDTVIFNRPYKTLGVDKGDKVRFSRNDPRGGLVNGEFATVESMDRQGVNFRLENGSLTRLGHYDPQMRHLNHAFASTVHAFQGRTVDRIIAAMPAQNPNLTNQPAFYVAISRARYSAELVTDDANKLANQLQRETGERLTALDAAAEKVAWETVFGKEADAKSNDKDAAYGDLFEPKTIPTREPFREKAVEPKQKSRGMDHDLGL